MILAESWNAVNQRYVLLGFSGNMT